MTRWSLIGVAILFFISSCGSKQNDKNTIIEKNEVEIAKTTPKENTIFPVYNFDGLAPLLHKKDNKTYIINFWATWCVPCVEELPYFEKTFAEQKDNNVEMILVSLDMPSMWKSRLEPFVKKRGLKGQVVILDDPKMNDWIPKINKDWEGGIPATLIYNKEKRIFYPKGFTYEELNTELNKFIN